MTENERLKEEKLGNDEDEVKEVEKSLPRADFMGKKLHLLKYENFWYPSNPLFKNILTFQKHFHARDTDLIIASLPKAGTTWLKSLLFAVVNHPTNQIKVLSFLIILDHDLVYRLENGIYGKNPAFNYPCPTNLKDLPSPFSKAS